MKMRTLALAVLVASSLVGFVSAASAVDLNQSGAPHLGNCPVITISSTTSDGCYGLGDKMVFDLDALITTDPWEVLAVGLGRTPLVTCDAADLQNNIGSVTSASTASSGEVRDLFNLGSACDLVKDGAAAKLAT